MPTLQTIIATLEYDMTTNIALRLLTSTRFAVAIIALIILLSVLGTILPHGSSIFSSPFFIALIGLFSVSTCICSLTKISAIWRLAVHPRVEVDDKFIEGLSFHAFLPSAKLSDTYTYIKGYRRHHNTNSQHTTLLAQKGVIGRFGPHIAHFGVLVLLLGVLIGTINGATSTYNNDIAIIPLGGSVPIQDFTVQLNDFRITYYDDGTIREYTAVVSIVDGNTAETHDVTVNDPFTYKGLTFYLYDYDSGGVAQAGKATWVAFQIKSEAGLPLIWAGAGITICGIMIALYIPHKQIWINESNDGLLFGGKSNKRSRNFAKEMDKIRSSIIQQVNQSPTE